MPTSRRVILNRRQALQALGAGVAAGCAPDERRAPVPKTPGHIDTIVVVMMENRSFDHYLGSLSLVEGRTEVDGLTPEIHNLDTQGNPVYPAPVSGPCVVGDPGHSWNSSREQFAEGANSGFVTNYESRYGEGEGRWVMDYQTRADLPVHYALADEYIVCQRWFCSAMTSTWPNRFYGHAGTSEGLTNNDLPEDGQPFAFETVWTQLDNIGVGWRYYYTDLPFLGLMAGHMRTETTGLLEDFFFDCANGLLPPVVWIDPGFAYNDDHPPHHPGVGQEFLGAIYAALADSPHWETCLLVITYDEHGGFHDHVPPGTIDDDYADEGFDQLGFRVPALVAGPYVRSGVSDTVFDNTSWIKLVCELHGIEPWNKRIAATQSLAELLDVDRMARGEPRPPVELPPFTFDDSLMPLECQYGQGVLGPTLPSDPAPMPAGHQEELYRFIRARMPEKDHTDEIARHQALIRGVLRRAGLVRPAR